MKDKPIKLIVNYSYRPAPLAKEHANSATIMEFENIDYISDSCIMGRLIRMHRKTPIDIISINQIK